ncbi:MAG: helix-turn-helix domain-containing protein [Oscillospiraceae bacterium]|nr:helix-turn-helix domain-containing protein [Oscillospiraceae bacterium]
MDTITVGKVIKRYRENKKLSQEVLSGLACVDRSHLSKIELGIRSPTITVLNKLADALGVNPSDILRDVEAETKRC